jgi:hypothetical protein
VPPTTAATIVEEIFDRASQIVEEEGDTASPARQHAIFTQVVEEFNEGQTRYDALVLNRMRCNCGQCPPMLGLDLRFRVFH